jgi:hypothetical protein
MGFGYEQWDRDTHARDSSIPDAQVEKGKQLLEPWYGKSLLKPPPDKAMWLSPDVVIRLVLETCVPPLLEALAYVDSGLGEIESQLRAKGCWCPGAGDEQCSLCNVRDVRQRLARTRAAWTQSEGTT